MLWSNPRVVFFREEPLPDEAVGPRGAQGVPLTPGRSVAVDPLAVPYGSVLWLDTTEPLTSQPLRRVVMAQDTGSAISGAVRIDYFWGWGGASRGAGRAHEAARARLGLVAAALRRASGDFEQRHFDAVAPGLLGAVQRAVGAVDRRVLRFALQHFGHAG